MSASGTKGEFNSTWTSIAVRPGSAGNMVAEVNMEGQAVGYGPFVGTMTVTPSGADEGTWHWASTCWLETGGWTDLSGQGRFKNDGKLRWKATGVIRDEQGRELQVDSVIDMASKTWKGTALGRG